MNMLRKIKEIELFFLLFIFAFSLHCRFVSLPPHLNIKMRLKWDLTGRGTLRSAVVVQSEERIAPK